MPFILLGIAAIIIALDIIILDLSKSGDTGSRPKGSAKEKTIGFWKRIITPEYKLAGIRGEETAVREIKKVLHDDDNLFTNVIVSYDGKPTELDNVIVNKYGVFIVEVKNYSGIIIGNEDEYEWKKYKTTEAGNCYEKSVKNPIRQVKRQVYILARYLESSGAKVWVKGYAILINGNSPVESEYMLNNTADIDQVIHTRDREILNTDMIRRITKLLSDQDAFSK